VTVRPLILLGALLGLLLGTVAAFAIPRTSAGEHVATTTAVAPPAAAGPAGVVRTAPAWPTRADVELRLEGTPRVEARAADPLGGPEWAVRVFRAARVVKPASRRHGVDPVIGHNLCAQLGRLHRGQFGWLDAEGTFRPLRVTSPGTGTWCGSRAADLRRSPQFETLSTITEPSAPAARVKSTLVWGVAGSAARDVTLKLGDRTVAPAPTAHRAFLAVAGPELDQHRITGSVAYPGRTVRLPVVRPGAPSVFHGADPTAKPGTGQPELAARAPDPNGGLPFGLVAGRSADGGWCLGTGGRIVGERVGGVDYRRDTLSELQIGGGSGCSRGDEAKLFRRVPVLLGYSTGGGDLAEEGGDSGGTGRIARRTQPGLMIYNGRVAPDVVSVTLETPRDVRTLIPGGPAHAILAVYDGSFPTGQVRVIARFRDGHTKVQTIGDVGF